MRKRYSQLIQQLKTKWTGFRKGVLFDNRKTGYAFVSLPLATETEVYKQKLADIEQYLEAGYRVIIVEEQRQTTNEPTSCLKDIYGVLSEIQIDLKTLKERAV